MCGTSISTHKILFATKPLITDMMWVQPYVLQGVFKIFLSF